MVLNSPLLNAPITDLLTHFLWKGNGVTNKNLIQEWPYKSQRISPGQHWTSRCTQNTNNHRGSLQLEIHRWHKVLNMMKFCRHRIWRWGHRIPLKNNVTKLIDQSFACFQKCRIEIVDSAHFAWSHQLHFKVCNSVTCFQILCVSLWSDVKS